MHRQQQSHDNEKFSSILLEKSSRGLRVHGRSVALALHAPISSSVRQSFAIFHFYTRNFVKNNKIKCGSCLKCTRVSSPQHGGSGELQQSIVEPRSWPSYESSGGTSPRTLNSSELQGLDGCYPISITSRSVLGAALSPRFICPPIKRLLVVNAIVDEYPTTHPSSLNPLRLRVAFTPPFRIVIVVFTNISLYIIL